jgi:uncharacterized OB-fold protein
MTAVGLKAGDFAALTPPMANPLFDGFWKGTREGRIMLPRCQSCNRFHWYPLHRCPHCQAEEWAYSDAGLEGRIFAYGVIRRPLHPGLANRAGQIVSLVTPDAAPTVRLVTNIVGVDAAHVEVGAAVHAEFIAVTDEWTVPVYRVAAS